MAYPAVLPSLNPDVCSDPICHTTQGYKPSHARSAIPDIRDCLQNNVSGMSCIRHSILSGGLTVDTTNIIMASWRANTRDKYGTYINQWLSFCESKGINYLLATTNDGLCFLTEVFNKGCQYHTVAAARSALSAILPLENGLPFGEWPLVSKFVKGVANIRPPLPKYTSVWSVDKLFDCFRGMDDNDRLSLKGALS